MQAIILNKWSHYSICGGKATDSKPLQHSGMNNSHTIKVPFNNNNNNLANCVSVYDIYYTNFRQKKEFYNSNTFWKKLYKLLGFMAPM